jgi:hypothetical protein
MMAGSFEYSPEHAADAAVIVEYQDSLALGMQVNCGRNKRPWMLSAPNNLSCDSSLSESISGAFEAEIRICRRCVHDFLHSGGMRDYASGGHHEQLCPQPLL